MIRYAIDTERGMIRATVSPSAQPSDMLAHIQRVLKDPDFCPQHNSLVIFKDSFPVHPVDHEQWKRWCDVLVPYAERRPGAKWALVVADAVEAAFMTQAFAALETTPVNISVFHFEPDACKWLCEGIKASDGAAE